MLEFELHKLNIYGPGSFFKPHVDTPRADNMVGSLVVVLPTKHEGGQLVLRHRSAEWSLDSAKLVSESTSTRLVAAYTAFYSDVSHEVLPVISGYRVTLTYNLYAIPRPPDVEIQRSVTVPTSSVVIKAHLDALLENREFLPKGGFLGFRLAHLYPCNVEGTPAASFTDSLKGIDAVLYHVLGDMLKLKCRLAFAVDDDLDSFVLCDTFVDINHNEDYSEGLRGKIEKLGSRRMQIVFNGSDEKTKLADYLGEKDDEDGAPLFWIGSRMFEKHDAYTLTYMTYGNEANLNFMYAQLCIIAEVEGRPDEDLSD